MPTKLFASMGLSLCALIFLLLVFLMYLSKKKFRTFDTSLFFLMFCLTFLLHINEILYIYAMYAELDASISFLPVRPLCYAYLFGCIMWFTCLIMYIWAKSNRYKDEAFLKKKRLLMLIFLTLVIVLVFSISCMLDIEYPTSNSNLYVFAGPAVYVLYMVGIVALSLMGFSVYKKGTNIPAYQKRPMTLCLLLLIIVNTIQLVFDYDFNSLTFLFTFVITTLYFTIESQDYKLINELEGKREEAEIADEAQTEFLTNMSHEIRTPLNTILGFSEALLSQKVLTKEAVEKDIPVIYDAGNNLTELINKILDISKIESGKTVVEEKDYSIDDLVFIINEAISSKVDNNKVKFAIDVNANIPKKYHGDDLKISRCLICIIDNAIKYTNVGSIILKITGNKIDNNMFEFTFIVSNTGHEMDEEKFAIDFNDFVKLGTSKRSNIDSAALGLIVSKRFIQMLEGTIEFSDKELDETIYTIKLKQRIINDKNNEEVF